MALQLNGTSDYIDVPANALLQPPSMSFSSWFNVSTFAHAYNTIMSTWNGTQYIQVFVKSSGQLAYYLSSGVGIDPGSITVGANAWHHVAFSFTPGTFNCYVDGVLDTGALPGGSLTPTGTNVEFGKDPSNAARFFNGSLADFSIYNVALTASDVALLARGLSPLVIKASNLVGYWPLSGAQGARDRGPNGFLANLFGTAGSADPPYLIPYPDRILSTNFTEGEMPALFIAPTVVVVRGGTLPFMGVG